jgi:hypothetical protein
MPHLALVPRFHVKHASRFHAAMLTIITTTQIIEPRRKVRKVNGTERTLGCKEAL